MRAGFAGAASLVAVALIAASCGGTQAVGTGASDIVPSSAPVFIQVDTDPGSSQWQTVNDLASRFPDKQKAVDAIKKDLRKQGGLDWNDDVKPALGKELDVIWLDFRNGGTDAVALTQPGDEQKFAEVIRKGNAHDPSGQLVYEKFADWEVISDSRAKIQRFEEQSKSASSTLGDDPNFGHAMDKLGDAVVRAYVSGPQVMREALNAAGRQGRPVIRKLGSLDWAAAALGATSKRCRAEPDRPRHSGKAVEGFRRRKLSLAPRDHDGPEGRASVLHVPRLGKRQGDRADLRGGPARTAQEPLGSGGKADRGRERTLRAACCFRTDSRDHSRDRTCAWDKRRRGSRSFLASLPQGAARSAATHGDCRASGANAQLR